MNKLVKILLVTTIILIILVIGLYYYVIQLSKQCLNSTLTNAEINSEIGSRVSELEDRVEQLERIVETNN